MSVPIALADLRASLRRELQRLHARPQEGGPFVAYREGALIMDDLEVTPETLERLRALPDGAGAKKVWEALND